MCTKQRLHIISYMSNSAGFNGRGTTFAPQKAFQKSRVNSNTVCPTFLKSTPYLIGYECGGRGLYNDIPIIFAWENLAEQQYILT